MRLKSFVMAAVILASMMPVNYVHAEELPAVPAEYAEADIAEIETADTAADAALEETAVEEAAAADTAAEAAAELTIPVENAVPAEIEAAAGQPAEQVIEEAEEISVEEISVTEEMPAQVVLTDSGSAWNGTKWLTAADFPWLASVDRAMISAQQFSYIWAGPALNRYDGINYGPSGKESYYNLNMSQVVANMHAMGFAGEYWVRSDGVKMFGNYIMCAANLSVHPRGSLVECSLGTCIVCDTGDFSYANPTMLDIAVNW